MRLAAVALIAALPLAAHGAETPPAPPQAASVQTPLRGADCLDPARSRNFLVTSKNEVLVDSGKRKYRLWIGQSCPALTSSPVIGFRGDQVSGHLCGGLNDAVVTTDYPCKVDRVELLTSEQYKAATDAYVAERKAKRRDDKSKDAGAGESETP
jgi:Family of unknown function (DUF6491)